MLGVHWPMMRIPILFAALAVFVAGCAERQANDSANASPADVDVLPPDESVATPSNNLTTGVIDMPGENTAAPNPVAAIPAALHGRWGLTPGDCSSRRGDAKGEVLIAADSIRFYESVAKPAAVRSRSDRAIAGDFAFSGEGQTWTSPMQWSVSGNKLIRIDSQAESRLVYTRC